MSKYTREDFDFIKELGKGAYSEVFLTKFKKTNTFYATKVIKKDFVIKEKKINTVKMEKEVLNMLDHPNIISLFCTFQDKDHLYFVLELAPGGELGSIIEKYGPLTLEAARFYMAELVNGLEFIHSKGILHRDLKPENLILTETLHLKITDFGTAKILKTTKPLTSDGEEFDEPVLYVKGTFVGTAHYVSPEILKDLPQSESSDLWALGCILYNFLTGRQLFDGESQYLIFQKITAVQEEGLVIEEDEERDEDDDETSSTPLMDPDAIDFIRQVCQFDAEKRLGSRQRGGMSELKKHPFFKGIDFSQLGQMTPPTMNAKYPGPNLSSILNGGSTSTNGLYIHHSSNNGQHHNNGSPSTPSSPVRSFKPNGHIRSLSSSSETSSSSSTASSSSGQIVIDGNLRRTVSGGSELTESLNDRWSKFLMKNENVVYTALVIKRRRFTAKKRQLILTDKPRILYIDPEKMLLKGIIPWSNELYVVKKNSREFTIQTPGRNYQLEDLSNGVDAWYDHIEEIKEQMKNNK
ncbi:hypothetical protein C9374_000778 [Naegleria lovaniensis]|uniref:non-specific serine/threonine protein kinase n=1 Tax=Naegleria lovaniensis TaxID=51637 RepID=A0AA88GYE6_NAELO|nr:uncharacterized protein C9374_000778 [Naegleria lovaniensis]KAG2387928.1 hypothetical protein C9374_000778 [Naegleria lovaniensis]